MESFLLYIGKAALAAAAFYLLYLALFQHQKHFTFNRIYLPVSLALSFLIPLVTFTSIRYIEASPQQSFGGYAYLAESSMPPTEPGFQWLWYHYLLIIYVLGSTGFLLYLILGHIRAISIIRKSQLQKLFNINVNVTFRDVHPFSFFNKIVLSEKTLKNPNLGMIVQHEAIHVRGKHTLDILFAEILFLFQWFNPFAWLLKDAIKNNLEYLTDHELTKTNDAQEYQLAMVGLAHKQGVAPFLTALNGSQLKNRIIMMKKKTENKFALLKQLVVLPLLAILVMGLSNKEVKTEILPKYQFSIVVDGEIIPNDVPAFTHLDFTKEFKGEDIISALDISEEVVSNFLVIDENTESLKYFIKTTKYIPGKNAEFDKLTSEKELPDVESYKAQKMIYAVDNQIIETSEAKILNNEYESATILTGKHALEKYGDVAQNASVLDLKTGEPRVKVQTNRESKERIVKGNIADLHNTPIENVAVYNRWGNKVAETDKNGDFVLSAESDPETFFVAKTGFEPKYFEYSSDKTEEIISIPLKENNTNLIKGKITDFNGSPIAGAAVLIKGTNIGTISDREGNYEIRLDDENSTLVFVMLDYVKQEIEVNGRNEINVQLEGDDPDNLPEKLDEPVYKMVDKMPEFPGGDPALRRYIAHSLKYPKIAMEKGIQGKVYVSFVVNKLGKVVNPKIARGVDPWLDKEALRIVSSLPLWKPGKKDGENVNVSYTVPINFLLNVDHFSKSSKLGLDGNRMESRTGITVSGKVTNEKGEPVSSAAVIIKGTTIGTITDSNGMFLIGLNDKNDVLVISMVGYVTRDVIPDFESAVSVVLKADGASKAGEINVKPAQMENSGGSIFRFNATEKEQPLFVVDGKVVQNVDFINPRDIEAIEVLKNEAATALYGEQGKNGVILITTKTMAELKKAEPLLMLNGEKTDKSIDDFDPDEIESVSVFKGDEATKKYGDDGKNGVIEIRMKEKNTSELDLRKFLARNFKYPVLARKNKKVGLIKVGISIDAKGNCKVLDELPKGAKQIDEVVVVGYGPEPEPDSIVEISDEVLEKEVKRVIKMLPLIDIPDLKGTDAVFSVKFMLE